MYVCMCVCVCVYIYMLYWASLVAQTVKKFMCNAGDLGSYPRLGRFPGEGNGNSLQYSCLGNPKDRGVWRATVQGGHKELDITE